MRLLFFSNALWADGSFDLQVFVFGTTGSARVELDWRAAPFPQQQDFQRALFNMTAVATDRFATFALLAWTIFQEGLRPSVGARGRPMLSSIIPERAILLTARNTVYSSSRTSVPAPGPPSTLPLVLHLILRCPPTTSAFGKNPRFGG